MRKTLLVLALLSSVLVQAQRFDFNTGDQGWSIANTNGAWDQQAGCLTLSASGETSYAWASPPLSLTPQGVYRMRFRVRGEGARGTVTSGPSFANMDVTAGGSEWQEVSNFFTVPEGVATAPFRLGQWHLSGKVFFDDVELTSVRPVYARKEAIVLGEGEQMTGNAYTFQAPLNTTCRNHSRPLKAFTASFNSSRWCLGDNTWVVYDHRLPKRTWRQATLSITCGYYAKGEAAIESSLDALAWNRIGSITNTGTVTLQLDPAVAFIRLRGEKNSYLQIHNYVFSAILTGEPLRLIGATHYLESDTIKPEITVEVIALGSEMSGSTPEIVCDVTTPLSLKTQARITFSRIGDTPVARTEETIPVALKAGTQRLRLPYTAPGCGTFEMTFHLGDFYRAATRITIPDYFATHYGERLPSKDGQVALWTASSGWKIPKQRVLPQAKTQQVEIKLAKNEWEAAQLILTPARNLSQVTVRAEELEGLRVDLLRVGYVPVTLRTDKTGVLTDWPDPLMPTDKPFDMAAGENQPLWIRVKAPKGVRAGSHRGELILESKDGLRERVRLNVQVFDFTLPDTMTCETAFGCGYHQVKRYHRLKTTEQEQEVYAHYLQSLADHRLSPYNPAPLAHWSVHWEGGPPWKDTFSLEKVDGRDTLVVKDTSETYNRAATYQEPFKIPERGFRISFSYKTDKLQPSLFTFNHYRADGTWISGHNFDQRLPGSLEWKRYSREIPRFPEEATSCTLRFWGAGYQEPGRQTGTTWITDLHLVDLATGRELIPSDVFKPVDVNAMKPVFDWSRWDADMAFAFTNYHFNTFRMRIDGLGGGSFHARSEPIFMGYTEDKPEYHILLEKYLKGIQDHLEEKGWLDKAYIYWFDEPDPKDYAFVMNGFEKLKRYAPKLRRMLTEQVERELINGPNLWCPLTPHLTTPFTDARRAAGDQFWWYVCCGPKAPYVTEFIDHPGTEMRLWLWQTWKERVTGILIWETVYWTSAAAYPGQRQNPYLDPMSWVSDYAVKPGTKRPWGNGDGRFLYPPLAATEETRTEPVLEPPVDTYRIELLRDGIEDYEYFALLQRLLTQKGKSLRESKRKAYQELLTVPSDITTSMTVFTKDPRLMEAHRDKLARAIEALSKE